MVTANSKQARNQDIIVITGQDLRHQYFIKKLNARFKIAAVIIEPSDYPLPPLITEEDTQVWNWFFERRQAFEEDTILPKLGIECRNEPEVYYLGKNEINSEKTCSILKKYSPGFIAVFGIGILKENILSLYPDSIFNLHAGLPEYYRGSSCNFWPIYNCDLKKLGATIHRVEKGVDPGKIAAEKSIHLEVTDNEQSLIWKTMETGIKLMEETIEKWQSGMLNLEKQKKAGNLYKRNDFNPAAILKVKKMVESGELKTHIESTIRGFYPKP